MGEESRNNHLFQKKKWLLGPKENGDNYFYLKRGGGLGGNKL